MIADVVESACGEDFESTLYPDTNHFSTYERAYRAPSLYEWFLQHEKASDGT